MTQDGLTCPLCKSGSQLHDRLFASEWAVACHIAGSSKTYGGRHAEWIDEVCPDADLSVPIFDLAGKILLSVGYLIRGEAPPRRPGAHASPLTPTYESLTEIERTLIAYVCEKLQSAYPGLEEEWWRKGVPLPTRQESVKRREEDRAPLPKEKYLDLIDLKTIVDKNWNLFGPDFDKLRDLFPAGKKDVMLSFVQLNEIRRIVMHPAKSIELTAEQQSVVDRFQQAARQLATSDHRP